MGLNGVAIQKVSFILSFDCIYIILVIVCYCYACFLLARLLYMNSRPTQTHLMYFSLMGPFTLRNIDIILRFFNITLEEELNSK